MPREATTQQKRQLKGGTPVGADSLAAARGAKAIRGHAQAVSWVPVNVGANLPRFLVRDADGDRVVQPVYLQSFAQLTRHYTSSRDAQQCRSCAHWSPNTRGHSWPHTTALAEEERREETELHARGPFAHRSSFDLLPKPQQRNRSSTDHHQPRGALIKAMHDARPQHRCISILR